MQRFLKWSADSATHYLHPKMLFHKNPGNVWFFCRNCRLSLFSLHSNLICVIMHGRPAASLTDVKHSGACERVFGLCSCQPVRRCALLLCSSCQYVLLLRCCTSMFADNTLLWERLHVRAAALYRPPPPRFTCACDFLLARCFAAANEALFKSTVDVTASRDTLRQTTAICSEFPCLYYHEGAVPHQWRNCETEKRSRCDLSCRGDPRSH